MDTSQLAKTGASTAPECSLEEPPHVESENLKEERLELLDFDRDELAELLEKDFGLPGYRAKQIIQWVYRFRVKSFSEMTNVSRELRERLESKFRIYRPEVDTVLLSSDGSRKFLFRMNDGALIESVLIKQPTRYTLCISSQVGCAIACQFCRTGLMGLKRHLRTSEIIGQVLAVQDAIEELRNSPGEKEKPEQFQNIVFMGMGEPFHNLQNVTRTVKLLNDELGINFSSRKITVSTSGLVPAIKAFGESGAGANLAISLNATTDDVRSRIMPINKRWPLETLLSTLREYPLRSRKRITMEYVMLRGVNDSDADLERLPSLVRGIPVKINLIPYNNNSGLGFESSSRETIGRWQDTLLQRGLNATVRWSKANDISGACGQLATQSGRKSVLPIAPAS